jgi:AcrR family transcriptional regulator
MRDGSRTRARIQTEAVKLFAQKGIDATSVRDIAQAAGVAEGALYRHYPSKDALARDVFLDHYAALAVDVLAIGIGEAPLELRVAALVQHFVTLFDENQALFTFILVDQHRHLRDVPAAPEANVVEAVKLIFVRAMEAGEIPTGDAELITALTLGAVVQPATFRLYGRLGGRLGEPLSAHVSAITRAVLAIAGAASRLH